MILRDPVGVALGSIGAGASTGAAVITTGVIVYRTLQGTSGTLTVDQQFFIITAGLGAGMIAAMATAFTLCRIITDLWRRGVIVASTVFAATILASLAAPIDIVSGATGLIAYAAILIFAATVLRNKAKASARQ